MPTTRPGFIWSGTEWIAIGQEAVLAPVKYQATAPSSPATGDIWIESDVDVPSVDSAQFLRWRKTMTGGETSLSGNDDSSLPLAYTPGYEQLYINGVLQVRGQDYTATTGTTVTGLTALVANDVVEIFSAVARTVADVYTQTQSDARFVNKVGGVLQVVNATDATQKTMSVGSLGSLMTASITPTRATSKILVTVNALVSNGTAGGLVVVRLSKSGTVLSPSVNFSFFTGSPNGHSVIADFNNTRNLIPYNLTLMDSPNTTSQVTYSFDGGAASGSTGFFNRWGLDSNWGGISSMTLMEIGA